MFYCDQEVERENDNKESEEQGSDFRVDVDEELQTELCKLWDMSMNSVRSKHTTQGGNSSLLNNTVGAHQSNDSVCKLIQM